MSKKKMSLVNIYQWAEMYNFPLLDFVSKKEKEKKKKNTWVV